MAEHARVDVLVQFGVIEGLLFLLRCLCFLRNFLVGEGRVALQLSNDHLHDMMLVLKLVSELWERRLVSHFALLEEPVGDLQADEGRRFALFPPTKSIVRATLRCLRCHAMGRQYLRISCTTQSSQSSAR